MTKLWTQPRKVLAANDLTAQSQLALTRAIALSRGWGAQLVVLHAYHDERPAGETATDTEKRAVFAIEEQIKADPTAQSIEIAVITSPGDPAERILAKGDRLFAGLCVMGASRRTLTQKLLGTTIDNVLRRALQPVLCVRRPTAGPYLRIAVATDFSEPAQHALDCAAALFPEASLAVIHAFDPVLHGLMPFDRVSGPVAEKHEREVARDAEKDLRRFTSHLMSNGRAVKLFCAAGDPELVLREYVDREAIDLVVVGTHGRTGVRRLMLGSVAERLIANLHCDVLAVPVQT